MKQVLTLTILMVMGIVQLNAQYADCTWPPDSSCTEPWTNGSKEVWVTLPGEPPCSFLVRVYYVKRCLQIEIQDFAVSLIVTAPPGCATSAEVLAFMNSTSFRNQIAEKILLQLTADYYIQQGTTPPLCPDQSVVTVGKLSRCMQLTVTYTFPDGSTISEPYDSTMSWAYYQSLYAENGGVPGEISFTSCLATACCYLSMPHCIDAAGNLVYTFGSWVSSGTCPPLSDCNYLFCE